MRNRDMFIAAAMCGVATFAQAQQATVTAAPDGGLSASASAGDAPSISMQAGHGQVSSRVGRPAPRGRTTAAAPDAVGDRTRSGCTVTVRSADGSSVSTATVSGSGASTMWAGGSPGSSIVATPCPSTRRAEPKPRRRAAHRAHSPKNHKDVLK